MDLGDISKLGQLGLVSLNHGHKFTLGGEKDAIRWLKGFFIFLVLIHFLRDFIASVMYAKDRSIYVKLISQGSLPM